jgi:hypothetical protein
VATRGAGRGREGLGRDGPRGGGATVGLHRADRAPARHRAPGQAAGLAGLGAPGARGAGLSDPGDHGLARRAVAAGAAASPPPRLDFFGEQPACGRRGPGRVLALQRVAPLTDLAGRAGGVGGGAARAPSLDWRHEPALGAAVFAAFVLVQTGGCEDHAALIGAAQGGAGAGAGAGLTRPRAAARPPERVSWGSGVAWANAATDAGAGPAAGRSAGLSVLADSASSVGQSRRLRWRARLPSFMPPSWVGLSSKRRRHLS